MPRADQQPRETNRASPYTPSADVRLHSPSPYKPIRSEIGDLRLLELIPGEFDDDIVINLLPSSLSQDVRPYEALSYVWGSEKASREARVNGTSCRITANLDCALRHLRGTMLNRILWVDAISINQEDTYERGEQVHIMGEIYSEAQQVVIWLGPVCRSNVHLKAVLGAMQFHFSSGSPSPAILFRYMCSVAQILDEQAGHLDNAENRVFAAMHSIISRPWFTRVWVAQELALSQRATIHIGPYTLPWSSFESLVTWLQAQKTTSGIHLELAKAAHCVVKRRRSRPFGEQLASTIHLSATDPRDKIFGILGISTYLTGELRMKPDYMLSVERVFHTCAWTLLHAQDVGMYLYVPLRPIVEVSKHQNSQAIAGTLNIPSWVPDFGMRGASYIEPVASSEPTVPPYFGHADHRPSTILHRLSPSRYWVHRSLQTLSQAIEVSGDRAKLFAPGHWIGTITNTSRDQLQHLAKNTAPVALKSLHAMYTSLVKPKGIEVTNFVETLLQPKTSIGTDYETRHRRKAAQQLFTSNALENDQSENLIEAQQELISEIMANTAKRILFVTNNGRIGLTYHPDADSGVRPGDIVVSLFSQHLPFILRPTEESSAYVMVNVAGVHGHKWGYKVGDFFRKEEPKVVYTIV